jgi:hypothetical protein
VCVPLGCANNTGANDAGAESSGVEVASAAQAEASTPPADPHATRTILSRTAALVEGTVRSISYEYDEQLGPRTRVSVDVETVHSGDLAERQITLRQFGGFTPENRFIHTSLTVNFVEGARYLLFLRNDSWFHSALAAEPLRVERLSGREVLIGDAGNALTGVTPDGLRFNSKVLYEDELSPATIRKGSSPRADLTEADVLGTVDTLYFLHLIGQAVAAERVSPSGQFASEPTPQGARWNIVPTSPAPGVTMPLPESSDVTGIVDVSNQGRIADDTESTVTTSERARPQAVPQ